MSLNLSDSYFGQADFGHSNQNAPNLMEANTSRAVLYVFKPYENQFGDVGLRPFQYRFDDNFVAEVEQVTDLAKRGTARSSSLVSGFRDSINLNNNILPSYNAPMQFNASRLSGNYRFILIFTEKSNALIGGNTIAHSNPNSQVRRIYTGYFMDEPFNPATFSSSRRTLNPNSFMVITHKTIVGTTTEHGRFGARTSINTQSSEEIIHPQLAASLIGFGSTGQQELHLLTPDNCINSIETNDQGYSLSVPGAYSNISKDNGANVVADLLEQPEHHVSQIIKGMVRYQDDVSNRNRLSMNRTDQYFEEDFMADGANRMKLSRYMSLPRANMINSFDLDVDSRISPVELDAMVSGDLDVVDFDLQRPTFYETADQMEVSVVNQYSFLISSVISPILNAAGLNAMQFEYQIARIGGQVQDDFRTVSAEPNWPVPQQDLLSMVKAVEIELIKGIFDTIFQSKGAFHVAVSANATGMTTVRLSLVDQGYRCMADFELPTCMGGLISPLLGDAASNANNSEAIERLYNVATGTQNITKNFGADDNDFMDRANHLPWDKLSDVAGLYEEMEVD